MTDLNSTPLPWYQEGLKFKCTGCGNCCTGAPGFIWVSAVEMKEMAIFLNMPLDLFKRKYVRQRNNQYALIEKKSENHNCIFLKDNKCQIYPVRPSQCKTFPWWKENLNSVESWKLAAQFCEGINEQSPCVSFEEIQSNLDD